MGDQFLNKIPDSKDRVTRTTCRCLHFQVLSIPLLVTDFRKRGAIPVGRILERSPTCVQDGMAILLGPAFSLDKNSQHNPERVGRLEGYQPVELTEDLLEEKVAKRYTGGRNLTVNLLQLVSRHVFLLHVAAETRRMRCNHIWTCFCMYLSLSKEIGRECIRECIRGSC
jgi:hypothetical protein